MDVKMLGITPLEDREMLPQSAATPSFLSKFHDDWDQ